MNTITHSTTNNTNQMQEINDDHSLTYSSADSSIGVDEEGASGVFFGLLDGMMLEEEEERFRERNKSSISSRSPSSFLELEQSIHELEKCFAQCIKSSPSKETTGTINVTRRRGDDLEMTSHGEMLIEEAKVLLKRKEVSQQDYLHGKSQGHSKLACSAVQDPDHNKKYDDDDEKELFKRQRLLLHQGSNQKYSRSTGYAAVVHHEADNTLRDAKTLVNNSLLATNNFRTASLSDLLVNAENLE